MIRRSGCVRRCTLAACLVLLAGCAPERHYEAALVLQDFAAAQARIFLIHRAFGHVDLRMPHLLSWRFWSEYLPALWRLWRVTDLLLAQRKAPA